MITKTDCVEKLLDDFRPLIRINMNICKRRELFEKTIDMIRNGTVKEEKLFKAEIKIEELKQQLKEIRTERNDFKTCLNLLKQQL